MLVLDGLTVAEAARRLAQHLSASGVTEAALDARLLTAAAAGLSREEFVIRGGEPLDTGAARLLAGFGSRRAAGEPISRIFGSREFWGKSFSLNAATLDPRPDSETLIETVLAIAAEENWSGRDIRILDLGTGSGCLLLTLLGEFPQATGTGTDLSCDAILMARANAARLGLAERASFTQTDWLTGISGQFDLIVSNPPYIATADITGLAREVRDFDPLLALDGGPSGFTAYEAIASRLPASLKAGGWAVFEVGAGQAGQVSALLEAAGLALPASTALPRHDLAGIERVVAGKRQCGRDNKTSEKGVGNFIQRG